MISNIFLKLRPNIQECQHGTSMDVSNIFEQMNDSTFNAFLSQCARRTPLTNKYQLRRKKELEVSDREPIKNKTFP